MTALPTAATAPELGAGSRLRQRAATWRALVRSPASIISLAVLGLLVASAVLAPWLAPYEPNAIDPRNALQGPSSAHWLGTDELGRDVLSRVLFAGRLTLSIAFAGTVIAMALGTLWATLAVMYGGWVDDVLMRLVDGVMAIPTMLAALVLVAALGASPASLVATLGLLGIPLTARVVRASMVVEHELDHVLAARAFGSSRWRIVTVEILPNVTPTLLVQTTLTAAGVIIAEASLSFLGVGIEPPDATWGTLVKQGYANIYASYWFVLAPSVAIFATLAALNTLGDQLQIAFDPRRAR